LRCAMKVAALGFASPLHDEAWWREAWAHGVEELRSAGLKVAEELVIEARPGFKPPPGVQGVVAVILTGGTSKQVAKALRGLAKPAVLVAFPRHNSLPSALEARAYLKPWRWVKVVQATPGWGVEVANFLREALNTRKVLSGRVLAIGGMSMDATLERVGAERLAERLGLEVIDVGSAELGQALEKVEEREVDEALKRLPMPLRHADQLKQPLRLYLAAKRLLEAEAAIGVTFNCFKLLNVARSTPCLAVSMLIDEGFLAVCEAEPPLVGASAIVHRLLEAPYFIANVVEARGDLAKLAHCTAPVSMGAGRVDVLPHFESGLPMALDVELKKGAVTLLSFDKEILSLVAATGWLEASRLREEGLCRTQALVKVEGLKDLVDVAPGGHLLLAYGDLRRRLRQVAEALEIKLEWV